MRITPTRLNQIVRSLFEAAGCRPEESAQIADCLVEANLVGHDSHGVIRVPAYLDRLQKGEVVANQTPRVVLETEVLAILDGGFGFGQVMGAAAVRLGVEKASRQGVAVIGLRDSGHLGRIGDWPAMAARAGMASLHFVNSNGAGILVAPHNGVESRLSANPIAVGVPVRDGPPILLDISTCTIAEGKIRVALHAGKRLPEGCVLDGRGLPTDDPKVFYGPPLGAILPFGGHKGYGLTECCIEK